jgi:hypothetical protein
VGYLRLPTRAARRASGPAPGCSAPAEPRAGVVAPRSARGRTAPAAPSVRALATPPVGRAAGAEQEAERRDASQVQPDSGETGEEGRSAIGAEELAAAGAARAAAPAPQLSAAGSGSGGQPARAPAAPREAEERARRRPVSLDASGLVATSPAGSAAKARAVAWGRGGRPAGRRGRRTSREGQRRRRALTAPRAERPGQAPEGLGSVGSRRQRADSADWALAVGR